MPGEWSKSLRGLWRTEVELRIRELRSRLAAAPESEPDAKGEIADCLDTAEAVIDAPLTPPERVLAWWSGTAITAAWGSVHEAEAKLMQIESDARVITALPRLRTWIQRAMEGDPQAYYERVLGKQIEARKPDSVAIQQAYAEVIVANNDRYAGLRAFRNSLVLVIGGLTSVLAVLALWHLLNPEFISLCADTGEGRQCIGGPVPRGTDLIAVVLLGAVGGLLAIAFGLAETKSSPLRYDPKGWQVGLKPVAGAATALAGVLLIQSEILVAPTTAPSESHFLGYAVLFGFSQQLFTRLVDKRAGTLVEKGGTTAEPPENTR